jgi:hypothetical protein
MPGKGEGPKEAKIKANNSVTAMQNPVTTL